MKNGIVIWAVVCFFMMGMTVYASESPEVEAAKKQVPPTMLPGTIIIYDEDLNPTIVEGGFPNMENRVVVEIPKDATSEEREALEISNRMAKSYQEWIAGEYIWDPEIKIYPGMKVVYNEQSGVIDNIYYVDKDDPSGYSIHNEPGKQQSMLDMRNRFFLIGGGIGLVVGIVIILGTRGRRKK